MFTEYVVQIYVSVLIVSMTPKSLIRPMFVSSVIGSLEGPIGD
jgi:hypothetical protein